MDDEKQELRAQIVQCAISCVLGSAAWLAYPPTDNPKERMLAALIAGFGGMWLLTYLWVWVRFGWKAARGMTMDR